MQVKSVLALFAAASIVNAHEGHHSNNTTNASSSSSASSIATGAAAVNGLGAGVFGAAVAAGIAALF
ncbi:AFR725C-Ap [Eremothecium gossypii ATCC 10895]|uniref:AFR725C-Ap n=1 Tax=Eremothecium gossypii (strain ATCC 10895 / CBS 109.51 / FGSC 9923 / NRRL Y-1056) TaxID=284811 RepID=A0ZVR4_EREGS|nr:AFR725C-Ap [Eremothecium gossypii ATCC 10895]ABL67640.1 AFR725C-Ap [Eremothecium gossypii ATCC 10895]AEY98413.1 FAFR725C-Ap [Eremothecium gossypii FDAG1]